MEQSCRLCTNTGKTLTSIANHRFHAEEQAATVSLDHLIEQYLAISVNPSKIDPLICGKCLKQIEEWHAFRESCQQHDRLLQKQKIVLEEVVKTETPFELYITDDRRKSEERSNDKEAEQLEEDFEEDAIQLSSETEHSNHVPNTSPCPAPKSKQLDVSNGVSRRTRKEVHKLLVTKRKRGRPKKNKEAPEARLKPAHVEQPAIKQRPMLKICTICGVARTDMAAHMRWHNNERPYKCPHCAKIFLNSSNLKNHINLHTREKMYKCDLCDKEFPSTTGRNKHRETHTTERSHLCSVCGKSFKYRASLGRHKLIHFEEPKEKCPICDMLFLTKTRLSKHFMVHMDVKPFSCDVCGKAFNRKDNLKTHKKTHITGRRRVKNQVKEEDPSAIDQSVEESA